MKKLLIAATITMAFSAAVCAQSLSGLALELQTDVAALPGLNTVIADMSSANNMLDKESRVYVEDQKQKHALIAAAVAKVEREVKAPAFQPVQNHLNEYNARCGRTFNRDTEMGQYNQCLADKAVVDAEVVRVSAWWVQWASAWNKTNVEPINAVIEKQNARIVQNNAKIQANAATAIAAQNKSLALRARIAEIEAIFRKVCKSIPGEDGPFTRQEALKYCSSIIWDGISITLPPMYTWQGIGGATTN
jgi:hypothetical protein